MISLGADDVGVIGSVTPGVLKETGVAGGVGPTGVAVARFSGSPASRRPQAGTRAIVTTRMIGIKISFCRMKVV